MRVGGQGDHLIALFFREGDASAGAYTPVGTDVHLAGVDRVQDAVVMLHEAHHGGLNDSTAWGTALHVLARLGLDYRESFLDLLGSARRTHESVATFASVSVTMARHVGAEAALATYPSYLPLYRSTSRLVGRVIGSHRQYLAVTAAARLAMQTPVLRTLIDAGLRPPRLADVRVLDTPDGRWRWMLRSGADRFGEFACDANAAVDAEFGRDGLDADGAGDAYGAAGDDFDAAWGLWELVVYDRLAECLRVAGATPLSYNGHRADAAALVELARGIRDDVGLRVDRAERPSPDDRAQAASVIEPVRLHLAVPRWRAARYSLPMVEVAEHRSGHEIAGEPTLVVDARLRIRLAGLFDWVSIDTGWVHAERGPVVACRLIGETDAADSIILHAVIEEATDLVELDRAWAGRGPAVSVVAASCLADRRWAAEWIGPLRTLTRQVMLVDVELDRFAANLTTESTTVASAITEIADASGSTRYAAVLEVSDADLLWLYLGDEVTVNLFLQQVRLTPSITLDPSGAVAKRWMPVIRIVTTHLLATESFVDLNGLEGYL